MLKPHEELLPLYQGFPELIVTIYPAWKMIHNRAIPDAVSDPSAGINDASFHQAKHAAKLTARRVPAADDGHFVTVKGRIVRTLYRP